MNKTDIIFKTLQDMRVGLLKTELPLSEQDEEEIIISVLQDVLPDGVDILTCDDFKHLNVQCCDTCHNLYPHYDMSLIDLPGGGKAWVCDSVRWALYPEKYQAMGSPEGRLLTEIFGEDVDENIALYRFGECAKS